MPKLAHLPAKLAEAALVVRALLLLFGGARLGLLGVTVNTLRVLLVTLTILLVELADWDLFLNVEVEVLTIVSLATHFLQPVNAHLLLKLVDVGLRDERVK